MGKGSIVKLAHKLCQILCSCCSWPVKTCLSMFQSLNWLVGFLSKSVGLAACRGCLNATESLLSWFLITRAILKDSLHLSFKTCQSFFFFYLPEIEFCFIAQSGLGLYIPFHLPSMEFQIHSPSCMPMPEEAWLLYDVSIYMYTYIFIHIKTSSFVPIQLGSNIFQPISALLSTILSNLS